MNPPGYARRTLVTMACCLAIGASAVLVGGRHGSARLAPAGMIARAATEGGLPWTPVITQVPNPAGDRSAQPQLSATTGAPILSWVEAAAGRATLMFSTWTATGWSAAREAASGGNWFVNWADVPSVVRLADGTLAAHWLQTTGPDPYAYDVRLAFSRDEGRTWSASFTPHHDGTATEHGFASLFDAPGGGLGLVWLDGRAMTAGGDAHHAGAMSLRFAAFAPTFMQRADAAVDLRVCECCPTAAIATSDGILVAFRDRSDDEVRDIHVTRLEGDRWSAPVPVHRDGWHIAACPVNGPALSASGRSVALAWFTAEGDRPRAMLAFSRDGGRSFGAPVRLDDESSLGRVDVELLPDGTAVGSYVEFARDHAEIRLRRVDASGARSAPVTVSPTASGRASGYPRLARSGGDLLVAWTDAGGTPRVRTAVIR